MERKSTRPVAAVAVPAVAAVAAVLPTSSCHGLGGFAFHDTVWWPWLLWLLWLFVISRDFFFGFVRPGFRFFSQSSPSAKTSGQRTGLRVFSQSSPSGKISDQRIRPRGTSRLDPDSGVPAAIEKKLLSFKFFFKTDKFFAEARPLVFGRLGFFDFLLQSSPSAKISGQRTGLRFFSQSSPSAKISD